MCGRGLISQAALYCTQRLKGNDDMSLLTQPESCARAAKEVSSNAGASRAWLCMFEHGMTFANDCVDLQTMSVPSYRLDDLHSCMVTATKVMKYGLQNTGDGH